MRTERDVRESPVAGDVAVVIERYGIWSQPRRVGRLVLGRMENADVKYQRIRHDGKRWVVYVSLQSWRSKMRDAEVQHIAQPGGEA